MQSIDPTEQKFSISAPGDGSLCHANLTATDSDPEYSGADLGTVSDGQLVFNVRAVGDPATIQTIAETAINETAASVSVDVAIEKTQAFRPEYPEPVYRMDSESDAS